MKEYIKPKGRPKQSSKLWSSKNKKRLREKENLPCSNAEPLMPKPKRWKTCQSGTAANRMRHKRELKQKESSKSGKSLSNDCIALSSDEEVDSKAVIANVKVLPVDFETLKSSTGWMNDHLINAGLSLRFQTQLD